jgi:hypothetical protein
MTHASRACNRLRIFAQRRDISHLQNIADKARKPAIDSIVGQILDARGRSKQGRERNMRGATFVLALLAATLAGATLSFAQSDAALPDVMQRALQNARIPEGYGVAYTWRARQSWDLGGGGMQVCGEASYRFDPRAPRAERFRHVQIEGDGRCQKSVADEARQRMRHGRPDIEHVEMGPITYAQPVVVVSQTPESVTYSVRMAANPNWNGMFGDERDPLPQERQRERLQAVEQMRTEVTFEPRSARVVELVRSMDEIRRGIGSMRNVRMTQKYTQLNDVLAFPREGVATAEARVLLFQVNVRIETTYSDVQLVRLDGAAPVVAGATGPSSVDTRSAR